MLFLLVARGRRRHENRNRPATSGDAREGYVGAPRRARVDDESEEIWHDDRRRPAARGKASASASPPGGAEAPARSLERRGLGGDGRRPEDDECGERGSRILH